MKKVFLLVVSVLLTLLAVCSICMIIVHYAEVKEATDNYSDMQEFVGADDPDETNTQSTETTEATDGIVSEAVEEKTPISVNFGELLSKYPDVVGWLYCEGTPINYPIVQGDDNEYYLRRLPNGNYNTAGSLFADYRCGEIGETNNYIVYGHNMKNGTMFSSLTKYKDQSYYNEHPVMYLLTPDGDYKIELVAGFVSKSTGKVYNTEMTCETLDEFRSISSFKETGGQVENSTYITLSTCSYEYENARYVVIGRIAPIL